MQHDAYRVSRWHPTPTCSVLKYSALAGRCAYDEVVLKAEEDAAAAAAAAGGGGGGGGAGRHLPLLSAAMPRIREAVGSATVGGILFVRVLSAAALSLGGVDVAGMWRASCPFTGAPSPGGRQAAAKANERARCARCGCGRCVVVGR